MATGAKALALVLIAGAMAASPGGAEQSEPAGNGATAAEPRGGLICSWAMLRTSVEVGRRCPVAANPGLQSTLEHEVSRLEAHARERTPAAWPPMEDYLRRRIVGKSDARLCAGDAVQFYNELATGEPEALRDETDRLIALPGPVEWGSCV